MAPKMKVPADFGREHINSPVHGNLVLKLSDGQEIKTNSMIMSLNSPVIDNLTTNFTQSSLEMDDFTKEAVDCFVESLYTGEVKSLKKQIFEDVNKMAHVFEVSWLSKRCLRFYKMDILNYESNSYQEVLFACEIASRAHYNLKLSGFVRCFVKSLMSSNFSRAMFLPRYLANFSERSIRQIDMALAVAGNNYDLLMMPLISHLSINLQCTSLDKNTSHLLQNLNVQKFRKKYPILFENTANLVLEISQVSDSHKVVEIIKNFTENSLGDNNCSSSHDDVEIVHEDNDTENGDDDDGCLHTIASQTDVEIERCWVQAVSHSKYPLISGDTVNLLTTENGMNQRFYVLYDFVTKRPANSPEWCNYYISIRLDSPAESRWSYIVCGCTVPQYGKMFLDNVPDDNIKHWKITKTSSQLIVKCNNVIVLDFNYTDE